MQGVKLEHGMTHLIEPTIKRIVRSLVPNFLRSRLREFIEDLRLKKTKGIVNHVSCVHEWLDLEELEVLQGRYPTRDPSDYGYDPDSRERRGAWRAKQIQELISLDFNCGYAHLLEIACSDGMVAHNLSRAGHAVVALDIKSSGFDKPAKTVKFVRGDAMCLPFKDESFDCVFSYNALEHFVNPEAFLSEALRVVKTGGYIYIQAGPLYPSPWGLHAFYEISVPYCHFLFPYEVLQNFLRSKCMSSNWPCTNNFGITYYRDLWRQFSASLDMIHYQERRNLSFIHLIERYPFCFKNKVNDIDDLVTEGVQVLFQKMV